MPERPPPGPPPTPPPSSPWALSPAPSLASYLPRRALLRGLAAGLGGTALGSWQGMGALLGTAQAQRPDPTSGATASASDTGHPLLHRFGRPGVAAPLRVFAAGPPAAVLVACLAPERLLGWPMPLREAVKPWLAPVLRDKPVLGRLAGRGSTVSLEALLALQPDLVLDAGSVDETYLSTARRVAEQTGLPFVLVDGRLADSARQLRQLGRLLGLPARGEALAAFADEALAEAAQVVQAPGAPRPSVYLARGADGLETATAGAINAEIIEAAGGRNAAATGRAGVARVSMEQVLAWSPDWVLTQDRGFHRLASSDPVWRSLPALREGRLLLAPDLPFGWLDGPPALNRLLGVKWLAARLRRGQGVLAAAALKETLDDAQRFHHLFYGITPQREVLQAWLGGRG